MLVERLAGDARLDHAVEILAVHDQHLVHVAEIDRHAAGRRIDMAFQRGAGAEGDDRRAVGGADAHDALHVLGRLRKHHRIGRLVRHPGERVAMLLAHRLRGDQAVAKGGGQLRDRLLNGGRVAAIFGGGVSQGHKKILCYVPGGER